MRRPLLITVALGVVILLVAALLAANNSPKPKGTNVSISPRLKMPSQVSTVKLEPNWPRNLWFSRLLAKGAKRS